MDNETGMFRPTSFNNKVLERNGNMGLAVREIMASAINAVNPYQCIKRYITSMNGGERLGSSASNQDQFDRVFLIGFGKASVPMAKAILDLFEDKISFANVITKDEKFLIDNGYRNKLKVLLGGHPIPTTNSIDATQSLLASLPVLTQNDLVFVVISGGGSALFTNPMNDISLDDMQQLTQILLKSGADIQEINVLRKHLDSVKGGRLALRLHPAQIQTLILSDVIGDRLDMIASGPTIPDPTTFEDAIAVISKYELQDRAPKSIIKILNAGVRGEVSETLKPKDLDLGKNANHLIGTNIQALESAKRKAEELGYQPLIISSHLTGKTKDVAEFLHGILQTGLAYGYPINKPCCLLFGGEPTVDVKGEGRGGRNQDLVLHMVQKISDKPGVLFISLATDGEDGPTDAAGAASDALVFRDGASMSGLSIDTYINTNNSYEYFKKVGGLIKTGSTGTNVNDIMVLMIDDPVST